VSYRWRGVPRSYQLSVNSFPGRVSWLKDESLEDSACLKQMSAIGDQRTEREDLPAALAQFAEWSERDERHGK
jgi:hypothetical protein